MCQTVDHLLDINTTLHKVRELMSDDGIFFVDIVDFRAAYGATARSRRRLRSTIPIILPKQPWRCSFTARG